MNTFGQIAAFPGNVHAIQNLAHTRRLVAVECSFEAVHKGAFAYMSAIGRHVKVPGPKCLSLLESPHC